MRAFLYNALMLSEFDLIAKYFTRPVRRADRFALGVGDDCALLTPAPGMQLAVSTDMLVEGRHFFINADPTKLGHKCLAVNLSDLAAMGAKPLAFTLALALPEANADWLAAFSSGLLALADLHDCELIGGDTTKGPLNICITVFGEVPLAAALRRDAAKVDDDIWVSGTLGDARLALAGYRNELHLELAAQEAAAERMHVPTPRVALGLALRGIARAAIDISDGLCGDLQHILDRSQVGASLQVDALPAGPMLSRQTETLRRNFCLAGGDDYELCFTAAPAQREHVLAAAQKAGVAVTRVGRIEAEPGLRLLDQANQPVALSVTSFDHFSSP
jgi:thiamine-monophosphate kinase